MARKVKQSVGIIGLGIIGSRVAGCLRKAGCHVWLWNRSPRPEPNFLSSAREVADAAHIIQIFVSDGPALLQTVDSIALALTPGHIVLNHATVSPDDVREAARRVKTTGARFLDAPFTGSRDAAADAGLVYFIGGEAGTLRDVRPVLEASSKKIVEIGEIGEASAVKIATNLLVGATVEALAEALAILQKAGVDPAKFAPAAEQHALYSPLIAMKLQPMLEGDFDPRFALKHLFKDIRLALDLAGGEAADLPMTSGLAGSLASALHKGWGDEDMAAVARHFGLGARTESPYAPPVEKIQ